MALLKETTVNPGTGQLTAITVNGNLQFKYLSSQSTHFKALMTTSIDPNVAGALSARNEIFSNATAIKFGSVSNYTNLNINCSEYNNGDGINLYNTEPSNSSSNIYYQTKRLSRINFKTQNSTGTETTQAHITSYAYDNDGNARIQFYNKKNSSSLTSVFDINPLKIDISDNFVVEGDTNLYSTNQYQNYEIGSGYIGGAQSSDLTEDLYPSTAVLGSIVLSKYSNDYTDSGFAFKKEGDVHIHSTSTSTSQIWLHRVTSSEYWTVVYSTSASSWQNNSIRFRYKATTKGWINPDDEGNFLVFTGQHRSKPDEGTLFYKDKIGLIVVSTGTYIDTNGYLGAQISESLPTVCLSSERKQKNVFGVVADKEDEESTERSYTIGLLGTLYEKEAGEENTRIMVNSVGEGGIWVTNVNGNLENGDYITTCEIPGYGMKQDSEFLHNYTVAKITCDCDFDLDSAIYICEEFQWEGQTFRRAFVGCTYHCG